MEIAAIMDERKEKIIPEVNSSREFHEIVNDFGEPLEIVREAISNAIDWNASFIQIKFEVKQYKGLNRLFITFLDDGEGMKREVISKDFWGLGFSNSRSDKTKVGEKGHGTKIFLRSEKVEVQTKGADGAFEAICEEPLAALSDGKLHEPYIENRDLTLTFKDEELPHGTKITIIGYNDNNKSKYIQSIVRDYILWFTKAGSIEIEFNIRNNENFKIFLQCLDCEEEEEIKFGHVFPNENYDTDKLIDTYESEAANYFVKKFKYEKRLENSPHIKYQSLYCIEGDEIKRMTNPMISHRGNKSKGTYRVSDRYGIWICKDFIPITRKNEWINSFGTGSNAFVMIHGFVNCQDLLLTANRGDISNTDPKILEELEEEIRKEIEDIDIELKTNGVYYLREQQQIDKSFRQEKTEFERRIKEIQGKKFFEIDGLQICEPRNESEVFGLLIKLCTIKPDLFDFIPLDYNTSRGIDIIARTIDADNIREGEHAYIELKYILRSDFNHAFQFLRWIVCWDFSPKVNEETEFTGLAEENDIRKLKTYVDENGNNLYFLEGLKKATKVEVIKLKELLNTEFQINFD